MGDKVKAEPKGPDNNKRLAMLEASTLAIAAVLIAANIMPEDSTEDPLEVAKVELERLGRLDLDCASLSAFLLEHAIEPLEGERAIHTALRKLQEQAGEIADGDRAIAALKVELEAATAGPAGGEPVEDVAALNARIAELEALNAGLEGRVASFDAAEGRKQRKGTRQIKARKFGKAPATSIAAIGEAMDSGDELELAFGSRGVERIEFEPIRVYPAAFDRQGSLGRYRLRDAVQIRGAGQAVDVDGVALLRGGELVAWCGFPKPVTVPAGTERKFDRMIVFG